MRRSDQPASRAAPDGERPQRGDAYLAVRLGEIHELESRRLTALRDWVAATLAVASQQLSAFGVNLAPRWFFSMIGLACMAIGVSGFVYPRLTVRPFLRVEQGMMLLAWGTIAMLVFATDGSSSPYIFFYAQTMFYAAYFFGPTRLALAHVGVGSVLAAAPILYDYGDALHDRFLPTIAIALPVWWAMSAIVAFKHCHTLDAEREARRLALSDPLTQAANLRALEDFVAAHDGRRYAIAMVDLDGLTAVNARYGYFAGDQLLRDAADALREASRTADQVARIGGDEFIVVMPGLDLDGAKRWHQRFVERTAIYNGAAVHGVSLSATVGIAATRSGLDSLDDLIARADKQLFSGKQPLVDAPAIAPHAVAQRLAARVETPPRPRRGFRLAELSAPAGVFAALVGAALAGLMIDLTGGPSSVLMAVPMVIAAYFAYFGNLREAIVGVGATLVAVGVAVFSNGPVSAVAQTRFSTVVFGTFVIAYALQRNGHKLLEIERDAERLSLTDTLTNLPNRRAFDKQFGRAVTAANQRAAEDAGREEAPALILADLERFRTVNALLGHHGGDVLLLEVSGALRDAVGEEGTVFRTGGDQFAVLLRAHHVQRVEKFARRCAEAIRALDADGHYIAQMVSVEARVGCSLWHPGMPAADMINEAVSQMGTTVPGARAGAMPSRVR